MLQPRHIVVLNWKDTEHPEAGGAEVFCSNVARELVDAGARVTYVTSRPPGQARTDTQDGYRIRRMGGTFTVYPLALLWLLLHRRSVDGVIDSQNGIPFFSPLAAGRHTAVTLLVHHVHQDQFGMYFGRLMAAVGRWLESSASRRIYGHRAISTVSPSTRTDVRRRLGLRGPIYITPNGYRSSGTIDRRRAEVPTIACVGRLMPHKRWHLLIEAVGRLVENGRPVHLDLIGTGTEADALARLVAERRLERHVTLHGFVSARTRDELLARAWLTASTSVGEGWGLSVIEAAAQGVPAVAIDVAGLRDSVRHGRTGWLTSESGLVDTLADAVAELADPAYAEHVSEACRTWADSLQWSSTADRFRAILTAEMGRSFRAVDRHTAASDSAVLLTVDRETARRVDPRALSTTDQLNFCAACVDRIDGPFRILLNGSDERDGFDLIARLSPDIPLEAVDIRLCRTSDQIQWHAGTAPHNAPTLMTNAACPAAPAREHVSAAHRRIA